MCILHDNCLLSRQAFDFYQDNQSLQATCILYWNVILLQEFNPELYIAIGSLLLRHYIKSGSPISILQGYISLTTRGSLETKLDGSILSVSDYDQRNAKLRVCVKGESKTRDRI